MSARDLLGRVEQVSDAVDADEIAAVLESRGITDRVARQRYGHDDVFDLAEWLYCQPRRTSRRFPTRRDRLGVPNLLQGVCLAVPGMVVYTFAAGAPIPEAGPAESASLVLAVVVGWAVAQAISSAGYLRLYSDPAGAALAMAGGSATVTVLAVGGAVLAHTVAGIGGWALLFAIGQVGYCVAAATALVLGRAGLVLTAQLPAAAGAVISLTDVLPDWTGLFGLALSPVAVAGVAAVRVHSTVRRAGPARAGAVLSHRELAACAPYFLQGACLAILLLTGLADWAAIPGPATPIDHAAVALIVGVIAVEVELVGFGLRMASALRSVRSAAGLRRAAAIALLTTVGRYLLVSDALIVFLLVLVPGERPGERWHVLWALGLGTSFLLAALLARYRQHHPVLLITGPAALAFAAGSVLGVPAAEDRLVCSAIATTVIALALLAVCLIRLGRLETYR